MIRLLHNELIKALFKKRTYISFVLIALLIPVIVYAIDYGAISLQNKIYGQMQDSFIFVGSVINGYFSTYLIIAILISHMPSSIFCIPHEVHPVAMRLGILLDLPLAVSLLQVYVSSFLRTLLAMRCHPIWCSCFPSIFFKLIQ